MVLAMVGVWKNVATNPVELLGLLLLEKLFGTTMTRSPPTLLINVRADLVMVVGARPPMTSAAILVLVCLKVVVELHL